MYDKTMQKMFNDKYYEDSADEDEHEIEANKAIDLKLIQDRHAEVEADTHDYLVSQEKLQAEFEERMGKEVVEKAQDTAQQKLADEGYDLWFCCDGCMQPIPEMMYHFDCLKCDNFTFCMKCYKANTTHTHRFKK